MTQSALLLLLVSVTWPTCTTAYYRKPKGFDSKFIPDSIWAPTEHFIERSGYDAEVHTVRTPDGFSLTVHRLPGSKRGSPGLPPPHRTPVLCSAGLAANSELWVVPDENLARSLVDAGFDVWLANFRGSFYGLRHDTLNPRMHEFWDFSWNENGLIDLPSIIDYVLETTGRDKLMTIGHSMGVTAQNSIGRNVVNDKLPFTEQCMIPYCFSQSNNKFSDMCRAAIHLLMGKPQKRMDNDYALKMLAHFPGGASIRQVLHYLQVVESGVFKKYDFGSEKNLKLYGSPHSPAYNLSAITTPMHVYYGTSDGLVSPVDAQKFVDTFPSVKEVHTLPYNHVDFVLADDVGETLIRPIVKTLLKYI